MIHKITIKHVYQDRDNPDLQVIHESADYAERYAFYRALIDSGKDFNIEIVKIQPDLS